MGEEDRVLSLDNMIASPNYIRGIYHGKEAMQPNELKWGSGVIPGIV
jgi:hypothetical protein